VAVADDHACVVRPKGVSNLSLNRQVHENEVRCFFQTNDATLRQIRALHILHLQKDLHELYKVKYCEYLTTQNRLLMYVDYFAIFDNRANRATTTNELAAEITLLLGNLVSADSSV
jgi:hypothetical protein